MTTKELIQQYVTALADNRQMNASELEALLTEFAEKLKKQKLKPDFSGMIIHNYLKDCWQFCDGEIPTYKCINPDYINVEVFITSKK